MEMEALDVPAQMVQARSRWLPLGVGVLAAVAGLGFAGNLAQARPAEVDCGNDVVVRDEPARDRPSEIVVSGIVPAGMDGIALRVVFESGREVTTTIPPRSLPAVLVDSASGSGWSAVHGLVTLP